MTTDPKRIILSVDLDEEGYPVGITTLALDRSQVDKPQQLSLDGIEAWTEEAERRGFNVAHLARVDRAVLRAVYGLRLPPARRLDLGPEMAWFTRPDLFESPPDFDPEEVYSSWRKMLRIQFRFHEEMDDLWYSDRMAWEVS